MTLAERALASEEAASIELKIKYVIFCNIDSLDGDYHAFLTLLEYYIFTLVREVVLYLARSYFSERSDTSNHNNPLI